MGNLKKILLWYIMIYITYISTNSYINNAQYLKIIFPVNELEK